MRVKVGDIVLDQFDNTIIAQNFEVNGFGDLSTRNGGFSNDFTLPLTSKNDEALGFPSDLNISTREPYERVDAQIIDVGAVIAIGYLRYKIVEDNTIKCSFFEGNTEWFNLLKDKKMGDLDLSAFDHDWTDENITNSITANGASGYIYPLIDYGFFINEPLTSPDTIINATDMFPGMMVSKLVDQIFKGIGWTVAGDILDYTVDTPFHRMVQPFSAPDFAKSEAHVSENTVAFNELNTPDLTKPAGLPEVIQEIKWSNGSGDVQVPVTDTYNFIIILNFTFTGAVPGSPFIRIRILINGISHQFQSISPGAVTSGVPFEAIFDSNDGPSVMDLIPTDDVSVDFEGRSGLDGTVVFNLGSITLSPKREYIYGNRIEMSSTMPDMLQEDFVMYLFFSFGIVPQPDNYTKTVDLDLFRTIEDNIPNAIDWSEKLDVSKKITTDFTKLLNNYSRVSIMNYEIDEDDPELSAYLAETGRNFGEGQFNIDNDHLERTKEIYTAPFFPMININSFAEGMNIPQIKFFTEDPDSPGDFIKTFEPVPKIGILTDRIDVSDLSLNETNAFLITPEGGPPIFGATSIQFCWFAKTQYIAEVDTYTYSLAYDQIAFPNAVGDPLKDTYLSDQEDILNDMKGVTAFFKLSEVDIINLDFLIPVYIHRFKSYFYINKIKNFQGSDKTTAVELIRIGNG